MTHVAVIVENAQWVLFSWILANQGGLPVPVVPALFLIARFSPAAPGSVQRGQSLFRDHGGAFRLGARFLPELGPTAAGLAGAAGEGIPRFLVYGAITAALWAGTWVGLGYLVGQAVAEAALHLGLRVLLVV